MAQQASKPDALSLVPGIHTVEVRSQLPQTALWLTCMLWNMCTQTHTHANENKQNLVLRNNNNRNDGAVVCGCNPSYAKDWGKRVTWVQEFKTNQRNLVLRKTVLKINKDKNSKVSKLWTDGSLMVYREGQNLIPAFQTLKGYVSLLWFSLFEIWAKNCLQFNTHRLRSVRLSEAIPSAFLSMIH